MIANFKIKSMRYLMALAMVLISLSPISCKKEKGGSSELREIVITHPENGTMTIIQGESELIKYSTVPAEAEYEVALEWTSDDENVATVKNGRVKAHAPGTTTVHAKYESVSASVKVTVTAVPVTSFGVPKTVFAYMDAPSPINITVEPENANAASLDWKVADKDIAEVFVEKGIAYVKANSIGKTKITVSSENISGTKEIEVYASESVFIMQRESLSAVDSQGNPTMCDVKDGDSFALNDIALSGVRNVIVIPQPYGLSKLTDKDISVSSSNPKAIECCVVPYFTKKSVIALTEGAESGTSDITVKYKDPDSGTEYKKTFTVSRDVTPFTSETAIYKVGEEKIVKSEEPMSRSAELNVELRPETSAKWTSSNEKIATVEITSDGYGTSSVGGKATIKTTAEYGETIITATDLTGKNSLSFKVSVKPATFPAGTVLGIIGGTRAKPVYEVAPNTLSIRATYDNRYQIRFVLINKDTKRPVSFAQAKWKSKLGDGASTGYCGSMTQATGSRSSYQARSGSYVREYVDQVIVEDDAGNKLTCDVKVLPPRVFSSGDELRVEDDRKSRVDFGHTALFGIVSSSNTVRSVSGWVSFDITNLEDICDVQRKGPKTGESELYYKCKIDYFILTGKRKGSVEVTATDENGNVRKAKVSSGEFHFEDDSEICYSVVTPEQSKSDLWYDSYYRNSWSREDKVDVVNQALALLKVSKGRSGVNYTYPSSMWTIKSRPYKGAWQTDPKLAAELLYYYDKYKVICLRNYNSMTGYPLGVYVTAEDGYGTVLEKYFLFRSYTVFKDKNIKLYYKHPSSSGWTEGDNKSGAEWRYTPAKEGTLFKFAKGKDQPGLYVKVQSRAINGRFWHGSQSSKRHYYYSFSPCVPDDSAINFNDGYVFRLDGHVGCELNVVDDNYSVHYREHTIWFEGASKDPLSYGTITEWKKYPDCSLDSYANYLGYSIFKDY